MRLALLFWWCAGGLTAVAQPAALWPAQPLPSTSQRVATLEDKRITESSGLCLSGRDPALLWTHNDSGGEPCVFAIDMTGKTRAKVRIKDAVNFDWEDIALGKNADGSPALFIADIGDNLYFRPSIQVYQVAEPAVGLLGAPVDETVSAVPTLWRGYYPDGRHNAESLLVHPQTGRLYILTKADDGKCALYGFPQPLQKNVSMALEKIVALAFPPVTHLGKRPHDNCLTTSADFSPDGTHLLVATYSSVYEWELPKDVPLADALRQPPVRLEPELVRQMEGVCYAADGRTIWLTSENLPTPLIKVTRP